MIWNRKPFISWWALAMRACFNRSCGENWAQAAEKALEYRLNWRKKDLSAEKKNCKVEGGLTGFFLKDCQLL
jgi:hypothetical protein